MKFSQSKLICVILATILIFHQQFVNAEGNLCYQCVGDNQTYDNVELVGACTNPEYFTYNGKCIPKAKLTENCTKTGGEYPICAGQLSCYTSGSTSTCRNAFYLPVGSTCNSNMQCMGTADNFGNSNGFCADSKCVASTSYPNNGCGVDTCKANQFCEPNTRVCTQYANIGAQCYGNNYCYPWLVCGPTEDSQVDRCVSMFTQTLGGKCYYSNQCNTSNGDYCYNGICKNTPPTPSSVNCVENPNSCQPYEFCECNTKKCKIQTKYDNEYQESVMNYFDCIKLNNCNLQSKNVPQSCVMQKCGKEYCQYLYVTRTPCQTTVSPTICTGYFNYSNPTSSGSNNPNPNENDNPSSSNIISIMIIYSVMVTILVVLLI